MEGVGDDVIAHALAYLQAHELACSASTSARLNAIVGSRNELWRALLQRDWQPVSKAGTAAFGAIPGACTHAIDFMATWRNWMQGRPAADPCVFHTRAQRSSKATANAAMGGDGGGDSQASARKTANAGAAVGDHAIACANADADADGDVDASTDVDGDVDGQVEALAIAVDAYAPIHALALAADADWLTGGTEQLSKCFLR